MAMSAAELIQQLLDGSSAKEIVEGTPPRRGRRGNPRDLSNKDIHKYMKQHIKPGDVLVVGPVRGKKSPIISAFYKINRAIFGPNSSHVDMYAGKDRVVTADDRGVVTKSLRRMSDRRDHITVMRPHRLDQKGRNKAVKFAKSQVGKKFAERNLVGAALKELSPRIGIGPLRNAKDAYICSGLLANSLEQAGTKVHRRKSSDFVAPHDFRRSRNLKKVMAFDRDDKSNKWTITKKAAAQRKQRERRRKRQSTRGGAVR